MDKSIESFNNKLREDRRQICEELAKIINESLAATESKIWYGHPVWFIEGNPIVGYNNLKDSVRLLFWSGQTFEEPGLVATGSFKAAEIRFTDPSEINKSAIKKWLKKAENIQWDYKNIVRRKGKLIRL